MLRIHHAPQGESCEFHFYDLTLNGEPTKPWYCRVSSIPYNTVWPGRQRPADQTETASFISCESDGPVTLEVSLWDAVGEAVIRPSSREAAVEYGADRTRLRAVLPGCGHYTLEHDGPHHALHIFVNPVNGFGVDREDPGVLYFGPGVHDVGLIELQDGQTLFVDGGAVLYGGVRAIHKRNVRVVGYGVIDASREERTDDTQLIPWGVELPGIDLRREEVLRDHIAQNRTLNGCVRFYSCTDCAVEGVITRDSASWALQFADCGQLLCSWVKAIGMWRYNADGIDLVNCRHARVERCFLRNFDDCMVIKGIKGWDREDVHHITVTGCTIWCDWGSALELGAETCADEYRDILWEDCDILHAAHVFLRFHCSDRAWVHDITVRDIRCEYSRYDQKPVYQRDMHAPYPAFGEPWQPLLINVPIYDGPYSNDHLLGRVSDARFEGLHLFSDYDAGAPVCCFRGADGEHCSRRVTVEGIFLNGRRLAPGGISLELGEHDEITVK